MSSRGARLLKIIESYTKTKPNQFDSSIIFSRVYNIKCHNDVRMAGVPISLTNLVCADVHRFSGEVKLISLSEGISRSKFKIDTGMCNGGDTLHGGFIAACTDTLSVFTHLGNTGKISWTMSLSVDYIKSASVGEEITVDTSVLRAGSFPIMEVKFRNVDGALVARGTTSLMNGKDKYQEVLKDTYKVEE